MLLEIREDGFKGIQPDKWHTAGEITQSIASAPAIEITDCNDPYRMFVPGIPSYTIVCDIGEVSPFIDKIVHSQDVRLFTMRKERLTFQARIIGVTIYHGVNRNPTITVCAHTLD